MLKIGSYLKDTTDFLEKIGKTECHHDFLLATFDVGSLYTNIPLEEGVTAIRWMIEKTGIPLGINKEYSLLLLTYTLKHNYFRFDRQFYLQTSGTAMGANMAPGYANICMHWIEELFTMNTVWASNILK